MVQVRDVELQRANVAERSPSWQRLRDAGKLITSFGQLSPENCEQIEAFLRDEMRRLYPPEEADESGHGGGGDPRLAEFVSFIRAQPGRLYKEDRKLHEELMMAVMLSPKCTRKQTTLTHTHAE